MNEREMPRPLGAQEAGRTEKAVFDETANSCDNSSTDYQKMQPIFDLLPVGEDNAVSSRDLVALVGAASVRDLQNRIAEERDQGNLILSTCRHGGGYFRPSPGPAGQAEISAFISTLRSRALSTLRVLRAAKAALFGIDGQVEMDDLLIL